MARESRDLAYKSEHLGAVDVVAMEATGVYWIPVFEVLDRGTAGPLNSMEPLNEVLGLGYDATERFTQPGFYAALTLRVEFQGR